MSELRKGPVADAIRRHRLIIVLRRIEPQEELLALVEELAEAGARAFEITFDAPSAAVDIEAVRVRLSGRGDGPFIVGAGTILRLDQLDVARAAGADFGVAPVLNVEIVRTAIDAGFPFVPGALTPSEMHAAWSAGATFVKLFPASAVGPQFIREVHGPFREIEIIPTGGIDGSNAQSFLDAGAAAVGVGSAIVRMSSDERRAFVAALAAR
jgi:2-dehydro-3-deoxyphosphogluconate aldolase / (4S)-4-hydroxy-2-oxoglutarate aldolase